MLLCVHVIVTIFRVARPGGARSVLAESVPLKHQLLILNRSRRRAPNLHVWDRDVVRRILDRHYRPPSDGGPSWLTFLAQMKDSLWNANGSLNTNSPRTGQRTVRLDPRDVRQTNSLDHTKVRACHSTMDEVDATLKVSSRGVEHQP
jgi:hypothetical protein